MSGDLEVGAFDMGELLLGRGVVVVEDSSKELRVFVDCERGPVSSVENLSEGLL
jgi:hypothetical protein